MTLDRGSTVPLLSSNRPALTVLVPRQRLTPGIPTASNARLTRRSAAILLARSTPVEHGATAKMSLIRGLHARAINPTAGRLSRVAPVGRWLAIGHREPHSGPEVCATSGRRNSAHHPIGIGTWPRAACTGGEISRPCKPCKLLGEMLPIRQWSPALRPVC